MYFDFPLSFYSELSPTCICFFGNWNSQDAQIEYVLKSNINM